MARFPMIKEVTTLKTRRGFYLVQLDLSVGYWIFKLGRLT